MKKTTTKKSKMELIFIGDRFYAESGSMMSPIYDVAGNRQDWGFVSVALRDGRSVHIRPATKKELAHYEKILEKYKARG
jgi:hypothetical protein